MSAMEEHSKDTNSELRALLALRKMKAKLKEIEQANTEPLALIGIGCRLPGGANEPEAFWQSLLDSVDAIGEVPPGRWEEQKTAEHDNVAPRWGGFIADIDQFDANFFEIAPREAMYMDPQQRILLEVTWEALEHAGVTQARLACETTGVFIGVSNSEYSHFQYKDSPYNDPYLTTGTSFSILANRLSYFLDANGPSLAVDTACSSSLVALHLACQSLRKRECDIAIVGGINVLLTSQPTESFSTWGMLAPDGSCKTFDAYANGFVRSEGCGVVILERQSTALANTDTIIAQVLGSAVNQDGHSNGMTAPNVLAQQAVLSQALKNAGIHPEDVSYIETHGTGTPLGDPIEVEALSAVYGARRATDNKCVLGAVKTNIGHLEAASGIAGLIKTALVLSHKKIPPNLHFRTLNPNIALENTPFVLPRTVLEWESNGKLRHAGVSSFGFGGTNAHVILAEVQQSLPTQVESQADEQVTSLFLPLSARSSWSLRMLASKYYLTFLEEKSAVIRDICYSASVRRTHHDYRLAVCGHSVEELREGLAAFLQEDSNGGLSSGHVATTFRPGLVFVFPGQGSQWIGMGKQLLAQEPVFQAAIAQCERAMSAYVSWSLVTELRRDKQQSHLDRIEMLQPILFAIQVALASLWQSWGYIPVAVVGHSMGEVAAAYVAGIMSLDEACKIICLRSQLLRRVSGQGAMAVVELPFEQALETAQRYGSGVSPAVCNSPRSTVLSGDPEILEHILRDLEAQQIFCRRVKVDVASHSPQMDPLREDLLVALGELHPAKAKIPMYSTVTGTSIVGTDLDTEYWMKNLREPVLFSDAIQSLIKDGRTHFLELSSHPILVSSVEEGLHFSGNEGVVCASLRRDEDEKEALLQTLAILYARGYIPEWHNLYTSAEKYHPLPGYTWQHERFWVEKQQFSHDEKRSTLSQGTVSSHPLLGQHISPALSPDTQYWEISLSIADLTYLQDHQIDGHVIVAGAVFIEMILAANMALFKQEGCTIEHFTFKTMLWLEENEKRKVQVILSETSDQKRTFQIFSQHVDAASVTWIEHASGSVVPQSQSEYKEIIGSPLKAGEMIASADGQTLNRESIYQCFQQLGLTYGTSFQGIQLINVSQDAISAQIQFEQEILSDMHAYCMHPVILDACFQTLAIATYLREPSTSSTYVPIGIDRLQLHAVPTRLQLPLWAHAHFVLEKESEGAHSSKKVDGQLQLFDDQGQLLLTLQGIHIQRIEASGKNVPPTKWNKWFYELLWHASARDLHSTKRRKPLETAHGTWLVFADRNVVGSNLKQYLEQQGQRCIIVEMGEKYTCVSEDYYQINPTQSADFHQLLQEIYVQKRLSCCGIVHLWSLENQKLQPTLLELKKFQEIGCGSVLYLVQALVKLGWRDIPRLWLITQGAQVVNTQQISSVSSIAQASLWGLGRTIIFEHPNFDSSLIDLSPTQGKDINERELLSLFEEIVADGKENQIVLRGQKRYVARLVPSRPLTSSTIQGSDTHEKRIAPILPLSQTGTYLISGGLGGLGLTLAQWMVAQGARHLVLVSRHKATEAVQRRLDDLHAAGALIKVELCDIAQEERVAQLLQEIKESGFPLRGIIHAAGILEDSTLHRTDMERFLRVLTPKVDGAWNLHNLTLQEQLDFFVLFSSAASLIGSPGQGNYSAANAFLDALAHYRRSLELPALSLNWGPWSEVGMVSQGNHSERLAFQGIASMEPAEGLETFEQVLQTDAIQVAIMPFNARRWCQFYPKMAQTPLLQLLVQDVEDFEQKKEGKVFQQELIAAQPGSERLAIFAAFLRQHLFQVLRRSSGTLDRLTPFNTLGMDSMMALELRNRLEHDLNLVLPATLVWTYPSIQALSSYLSAEMGIPIETHEEVAISLQGEEEKVAKDTSESLDQYSENELFQLLAEELGAASER